MHRTLIAFLVLVAFDSGLRGQSCFPGTGGSLRLDVAVNGVVVAPSCPGTVHLVPGGTITFATTSPSGGATFAPFGLLVQFVGAPPSTTAPGIPGLWLRQNLPFQNLVTTGNFNFIPVLPPGGDLRSYAVPLGLGGIQAMVQAVATGPALGPPGYALSDAYHLVFN